MQVSDVPEVEEMTFDSAIVEIERARAVWKNPKTPDAKARYEALSVAINALTSINHITLCVGEMK